MNIYRMSLKQVYFSTISNSEKLEGSFYFEW